MSKEIENTTQSQMAEKQTLPEEIIHHIMSFHYSEPLETHLLMFFFNSLCNETRHLMSKELNEMIVTPKLQTQKTKITKMLEPKNENELKWRNEYKKNKYYRGMKRKTPDLEESLKKDFGYNENTCHQLNQWVKIERNISSSILKDLMLNQFEISSLQILIFSITNNGFMNFETFCSRFKEFHHLVGIPFFVDEQTLKFSRGYFERETIVGSKSLNFQILQHRNMFPNLSVNLDEHAKLKGNMEILMRKKDVPWEILHQIDSNLFFQAFKEKFLAFEKIENKTNEMLKSQLHYLILENSNLTKEIPIEILKLICENMTKLFIQNEFEMIDKLNSLDGRIEDYFYNNLGMTQFNSKQEFRILRWNEREKKFLMRLIEMKPKSFFTTDIDVSGDFDDYEIEEFEGDDSEIEEGITDEENSDQE
jgi:hypothetical protein